MILSLRAITFISIQLLKYGDLNAWMDKINIIIIELDDRFKEGCSEAFYNPINTVFGYT